MTKPNAPVHPNDVTDHIGITIREWLAGQALPGVIAKSHYPDPSYIADRAVQIADALIARLNQTATARPDPDAMIDLSDMED